MQLEKLEKQVLLWNRLAVLVPIIMTGIIMVVYAFELCDAQTLLYIASGLYFFTAIVWWWWTMKSIHLLVKTLHSTSTGVAQVASELKSIREELQVDKS